MNIRNKDLNLLAVFVGISEELNLSRASGRLGLSQPALSHALSRLREQFADQLKVSMKAGTAPRTSTLRMVLARLKDVDIAARPKGVDRVPDDEIVGMLRGMVKSRRESIEMYRQGHRQDLVDKEEAEIAVIEAFLPQQMDEAAIQAVVVEAITETGAASISVAVAEPLSSAPHAAAIAPFGPRFPS